MTHRLAGSLLAVLLAVGSASAQSSAPIEYVLSFPEPHHHWLQVEMTLRDVPREPLALRMSRTSPGRYALHEFAKNVFDVTADDGGGRVLEIGRPNPHEWTVAGHAGVVRVRYKVYGNRVDGTYLAVDETHAHMNAPATLMFARGLEQRPARVTLRQPDKLQWRVATQLFPTDAPLTFTAPNLQYLMDSPIEFGETTIRSFVVPPIGSGTPQTIRVALHHQGTDAELDTYVKDVERVVREQQALIGELPRFEPGYYTFLADYLPWANGDGMEHRNSTVVTSSGSLATSGRGLLGTVSHEFFHVWNVERVRPRGLEPFSFEHENPAHELWLAEGFTSYVDGLVLTRAGLTSFDDWVRDCAGLVNEVTLGTGRTFRPAVEMSVMAQLIDGARSIDRNNLSETVISYYPFGAAIALALDLTLRGRSDGAVTLDDFFRAMWREFGKDGPAPGVVARPYTVDDARRVLGEVSGDVSFADQFFSKYITGRDLADYRTLLARAGLDLKPAFPGTAWMGTLTLEPGSGGGARIADAVPHGTPGYDAGLSEDDVIQRVDERAVRDPDELTAEIGKHRPGDRVVLQLLRRGKSRQLTVALVEDPRVRITSVERALTPAERAFRSGWIGSRAGNK